MIVPKEAGFAGTEPSACLSGFDADDGSAGICEEDFCSDERLRLDEGIEVGFDQSDARSVLDLDISVGIELVAVVEVLSDSDFRA